MVLVTLALLVWSGSGAHLGGAQDTVRVTDTRGLSEALRRAKPGTTVLLAPGRYEGGLYVSDLRGTEKAPVVIRALDPADPPKFVGGSSGMQFSKVAYLEVSGVVIEGSSANGLNIDDGGDAARPSHHVTLKDVSVSDLPRGNHDAIKLSGVEDFKIVRCSLSRWGGSGIDMVGCHRGSVEGCRFEDGGDSGIQAKGGSSDVTVRACRFVRAGQRAVNLGGSTGFEYFRPALKDVPEGSRSEAKNLTVEGCTFSGSLSPVAYVGVDGARVRFNTFYAPDKWLLRILQETAGSGFVPCRNGVFEDNLVVFFSDRWSAGGVNVGPGTAPETFVFRRNFWFCADDSSRSRPNLPVPESGGDVGRDPLLVDPDRGDLGVKSGSPAAKVGAHAFPSADGR